MIIYCTTNLINGKKYIGKEVTPTKHYKGSGKILKQAIKKYGKDNFKKEILATTNDIKFLSELEEYYIDYYGANKSDLFYNITKGGNGGITHNQDCKKVKVYQFDLNRNLIKEWGSAGEAAKAIKINRSKIVTKCKDGGSYKDFLWSYNSIYSPKTVNPHVGKEIRQLNLDGTVVKIWRYLQEIQNVCSFDKGNILRCLKGNLKTSYNYKWEYV